MCLLFPCSGVFLISCLFSLSPVSRLKIINRDAKLRGTSRVLCLVFETVPPTYT